jgi:hypothetical protein
MIAKAIQWTAILSGIAGLGLVMTEPQLNLPALLMALSSGMGMGWCHQQLRRRYG